MEFKLTKDHEGFVITTKWKKEWLWSNRSSVTGIIKFCLSEAQLWYDSRHWIWLEHSCDMKSFKILSEEETIIWKLEHNM